MVNFPPRTTPVTIVILPGDHVGPEVIREACRILEVASSLRAHNYGLSISTVHGLVGGAAIDATGVPLPPATLELISHPNTKAILFGAVGGPEWPPNGPRPEQGFRKFNPVMCKGLLDLRKHHQCFANLRPCLFPSASLVPMSPIKEHLVQNVNIMMVRELCGGVYFGKHVEAQTNESDAYATDEMKYSVAEVERVTRLAAQLAIQYSLKYEKEPRITSVDKANVLATSRLWRATVDRIIRREFPQIHLTHALVDSAAMNLISNPSSFNGVLLTSNLFGDILSDASSVIPGSIGLMPSASLSSINGASLPLAGAEFLPALYEPIHGSAPDISGKNSVNPIGAILSVAMMLRYSLGMEAEAVAVEDAVRRVLDDVGAGGFGCRTRDLGGDLGCKEMGNKVCEVLRENLALLNALEFRTNSIQPQSIQPQSIQPQTTSTRRPMNLCEKILAHHAVHLNAPGHVQPGDVICCDVDWTMASELTWKGMEKTWDGMGRPTIWRKDRFWLAVDHTVDPRINHEAKPRDLILSSETFAREAQLTDYHGPNETILHTDFYRERAQPGMLVIGADSHTCSAGGLGVLAVGLGAADVVMPLVTGQTWFQVPETCEIRFEGKPSFGIGGKDAILWILGQLKRNTVAMERAVEYTGPGCQYLSCDARFAIANMTTEFGGIAGVFAGDAITASFIAKRGDKNHKSDALYFRADEGAHYADSHTIDLTQVESMVALYPSPDNVVPVSSIEGMSLDGCFIGACTTAEEDLILAALVLKAGLDSGLVPSLAGKRRVTPGSLSITHKLTRLGLTAIYERAGFVLGSPGCSYCLGIAADRADVGEVWLSSQNRNFKNRMGHGSIGNLASATTVAASSFDMKVHSPRSLLALVDEKEFRKMLDSAMIDSHASTTTALNSGVLPPPPVDEPQISIANEQVAACDRHFPPPKALDGVIKSRVQLFGDHVDTDAIIPAEFMPGVSDEDLGLHCFQFVRPHFRAQAAHGRAIVVAGEGFGSGSSREEAPRALRGCGVRCVIAKSFAFIYARNQYNMALLGITLRDPLFYTLVAGKDGGEVVVEVDLAQRVVKVGEHVFPFSMSRIQEHLIAGNGVMELYKTYGDDLFRVAMGSTTATATKNSTSSTTTSTAKNTKAAPHPDKKSCEISW